MGLSTYIACYLVLTAVLVLRRSGVHSADEDVLKRQEIENARQRRAVCNDFSNALYFVRQGSPRHWVIYFEGGGGCSNFSDCNQRYLDYPEQMQAPNSISSIVGEDILSNNRNKNTRFHNYTHVLVPYCSSDVWLGNRTLERFESGLGFYFDNSENADNFVYMGQLILRAVIEDLAKRGLMNAMDLVLVGSSAGGIGLLNSLDWINSKLSVKNTRVVIDSSWFVGYSGYHVLQFTQQVAETLNFAPPACHDLSLGYPCCVSPTCLFTKGYLTASSTPILAISSLYDVFTLERPLRELFQEQGQDDQALLALFNGYGSIMNETLIQSYNAYSQLSIYAPSCSQHVYLAPSGELSGTTRGVYQESLFTLTNPVEGGNWERVRIETSNGASFTLLEALEQWADNSTEHFFITDMCSGPACGACPSEISVTPEIRLWSARLNYAVLALAGLMTLVAMLIKLSAYFYMKYLLLQQKLFSLNMNCTNKKRSFPKPTHPVNVACTELSHHIELVRGSVDTREQQESTDNSQLCSTSHYRTNTKLQTFVPFYKHLCSKWYMKWATWQSQRKSESTECNQREECRPDSGFSSSQDSNNVQLKSETSSTNSTDFDEQSYHTLSNEEDPPIRRHRKTILNQVNMYINPGELVAIMGPSGSGKTTLLDVLLNRRTTGTTDGEILINGTPISKMRQWFVRNTGYVRQLATYYYNELTVRENLLFSMNMQAMRGMTLRQKLERVEQVIREMGLQEQADVIVGDSSNGGLSGGQRKRLAIAVQLLSVPNILFLDEPTSGLDSASSLEILKSLSTLAETGRAVVVTIHQPRSEIFHSFDKILLLCNGQVAFFGSPIKVWDFFTRALDYEDESLSEAGCSTNTADRILDLLKEQTKQQLVLRKYRGCGEPAKVKCAVRRGKDSKEPMPLSLNSRNPGFWHRLVSLEARASLRQTTFTTIYLPIVYLVFGTILGTTYLYTETPVQVMSVTCLLSCSSSLFMSSIIMSLLIEPLKLFRLEHSDGISSAHELILQVFIRMSTICTFPLAVCATIVFVLVYQNYTIEVYVTILLTFLLVNQCWLSIFILFTVLYPQQAHRLCPLFSAVGGFCCGFIVPKPLMPVYYRWIFYINPSYYAYAGTTVTVLHDNDLGCTRESPLECFRESSVATLSSFGLEDVNPIQYMVILIGMVWVLLVLAVVLLQLKVSTPVIKETLKPLFCCLRKRHRQVHSSEALQLVEHNPMCLMNSTLNDPQSSKISGHLPTYDSVIDLEAVDTKPDSSTGCVCTVQTRSSKDVAVSTKLLPDGKHSIEFRFPWERSQPAGVETDFTAPLSVVAPQHSLPASEADGEGREDCSEGVHESPSHVVLRRGESVGVGRHRLKDTVVQITMDDIGEGEEDDGIDERKRREMANEKWKQRKALMDTELRRLKHNEERAKRYSGAFIHQALDTQDHPLQHYQSSSAGIRTHNSTTSKKQPSHRSRSMQIERKEVGGVWSTFRNPLFPDVAEEEEEEGEGEGEEEAAGLGLPPKDVPFYEDKAAANALDMSQIPMEEIAMVTQTASHWNTDGGQDSPF